MGRLRGGRRLPAFLNREAPHADPIGEAWVLSDVDGNTSRVADGPLKGATDAASRNFLIFRLGDSAKVVLRPSGTEPKAKAYLEVRSSPWKPGAPLAKSC